MSIIDLKSRMADIPGIESLAMQYFCGREVYSIAGKVISMPAGASDADAESAIRAAIASPAIVTTIPMAAGLAEKPQGKPMAASGSFAASIKAMMAEARAGVEQARADGLSKVTEAVGKLNDAKAATAHVAGSMAKTIADEADAVMSELGLISNDLTGEASGS